jgi:hypothetical protein
MLHVAQSQYHDIGILQTLGYKVCWIERRRGMAVRWHAGMETLAEPDFHFLTMKAFADAAAARWVKARRMAMPASEVRHAPHIKSNKAIWPVGLGVHDWRRAGHDIRDQVARSRADTKAMTAKTRRQY